MTIKAVIFDMDGTLTDSEMLWQQGTEDYLNRLGFQLDLHNFQLTAGWPALDIINYLVAKYGNPTEQSIEQLVQGVSDYCVALILDRKPLIEGVPELLLWLKQQGIKMAIASASPKKMLEGIVERCQLSDYFGAIVSAEELPYNKPHPAAYLESARLLGVTPAECIGVEDSIIGMTAVKAANMRCIVVPEKGVFNDPRWSLADLKLAHISYINEGVLNHLER